jgi:hypothetical protein
MRATHSITLSQRGTEHRGGREMEMESLPESELQAVAMQQARWFNARDLGGLQRNHPESGLETGSEDAGVARLTIAQHEWRKVLNGTSEDSARRPILPTTDAISNSHWGDVCKEKSRHTFRMYAQNVNGLPLDRRGGQYDTLCKVIKEAQADVFLGQEHNLDSSQYQVKSILHDTSKQHWQRYRLNIATTPISFTSMYKPGGTFMLAAGNVTGRIISQDQDKWGRWVSLTFQGMAGRKITMVSAYQVVTDVARGGTTTATTQQYSLLVNDQDSLQPHVQHFDEILKHS